MVSPGVRGVRRAMTCCLRVSHPTDEISQLAHSAAHVYAVQATVHCTPHAVHNKLSVRRQTENSTDNILCPRAAQTSTWYALLKTPSQWTSTDQLTSNQQHPAGDQRPWEAMLRTSGEINTAFIPLSPLCSAVTSSISDVMGVWRGYCRTLPPLPAIWSMGHVGEWKWCWGAGVNKTHVTCLISQSVYWFRTIIPQLASTELRKVLGCCWANNKSSTLTDICWLQILSHVTGGVSVTNKCQIPYPEHSAVLPRPRPRTPAEYCAQCVGTG